MAECPHGMPKPSNCFDCMEEGITDGPDPWARSATTIVGMYDTECHDCGESMRSVGITRWTRGNGSSREETWVHTNCKPPGVIKS